MSALLTQGVFYLKCASDLIEGAIDEIHPSKRQRARQWDRKIKWILNDIYDSLTESGKEAFKKEVSSDNADPLLFGNVVQLMLKMSAEERDMLEKVAEGIVKGELIEYIAPPTE